MQYMDNIMHVLMDLGILDYLGRSRTPFGWSRDVPIRTCAKIGMHRRVAPAARQTQMVALKATYLGTLRIHF